MLTISACVSAEHKLVDGYGLIVLIGGSCLAAQPKQNTIGSALSRLFNMPSWLAFPTSITPLESNILWRFTIALIKRNNETIIHIIVLDNTHTFSYFIPLANNAPNSHLLIHSFTLLLA